MTLTEMNKGHELFGGGLEILFMRIMYRIQITILQNDSKALIVITDTEIFFLFLILEILQQECTQPATCISFPNIVQ